MIPAKNHCFHPTIMILVQNLIVQVYSITEVIIYTNS